MDDVIKSLAEGWGALRFAIGFLLLPALYLREAAVVHKEVGEVLRETNGHVGDAAERLRARIGRSLGVFELEWWLVAAITTFLLAVFQLSAVADRSSLLSTASEKEFVRGALNAYGTVAGLCGTFFVLWCKLDAYRALRELCSLPVVREEPDSTTGASLAKDAEVLPFMFPEGVDRLNSPLTAKES